MPSMIPQLPLLPHTLRSWSIVPTTLALLTSFFILFYISLTSSFFTHHHHSHPSPLLLLTTSQPSSQSESSPFSHRLSLEPNSSAGVPTWEKMENSSKMVSLDQEVVNDMLHNGIGNRGNNDVFHNKNLFLEDYKEMNKSFKIYAYPHKKDDPFAQALLPVELEPSGNYASESYFKKTLMWSHFITKEPVEADLFFLPFSIARLRHDPRVDVGGISDFIRSYISQIIQKYPFWNSSGGADHFYVACHSAGRSAMEKAEEVKFNAIQVVCSSSYFLSGYVPHKDASLPQIWPRKENSTGFASSDRKNLAFFAGSANSPVRQKLLQTWKNDSEILVYSGRLTTPYADQLLSSKFCLHVKGFEVNTARIADSLFYGCVPVIISNHYDLPFADILNWKSFSLVIPTLDIPLLKKILHRIKPLEYKRLHTNLLKVRKHFLWHHVPKDFDAFYMVMYELWLRRSTVRLSFTGISDSSRDINQSKCM